MIDKEDNFNEFLKQKVEESHFEFNEAYWLKAEKLIENSQPKRRPFWFGFGWGMLSLAIVGGLSAMLLNINQNSNKNVSSKEITNAGFLKSQTANDVSVSKVADASIKLVSNVNLQENQSNNVGSNLNVDANSSFSNTRNNAQGSLQKSILHNQLSLNNQSKDANITASVKSSSERSFSQVKNLSLPKLPESIVVENEEEDSESEHKIITIAEPIVIRPRVKSIKDIDVNIVAACENKNTHEWMFNLLAGVSDSRGFEGNTVSTSRIGFGYFGGFRLAYKLDKNWFVGAQPLLYSRGAVNTSIETEKTAYDFGANEDEFIVKNKALLFAELPVSIGYRIQRHQISIGAGFEYLLNVKSDVKAFGTSEYTSNQWGYTEGFNRFGTVAMFNYAFNVYNEFWLTMMVQKGFTDLTKEDYFTTNSKDRNFNLRIGVQYQFSNQKKKGK
jgi:hypothetical protein